MRTCANCGMYAPEAGDTYVDIEGNDTGEPMPAHECPEPFPIDIARMWLSVASTGALVTQKIKARVYLALRETGEL